MSPNDARGRDRLARWAVALSLAACHQAPASPDPEPPTVEQAVEQPAPKRCPDGTEALLPMPCPGRDLHEALHCGGRDCADGTVWDGRVCVPECGGTTPDHTANEGGP